MLNGRLVSLFALVTAVVMAANPIATVVSGNGLRVRGTTVPATSVSSWPVASGDELASGASAAVVMFKDQSRMTMDPNSRVKLEARGDNVCIFLLDGSVKLNIVAGAKMGVCGKGKSLVAQTPFEGQVTLAAENTIKVDAITGTLAAGSTPCATSPIFLAMGGKTAATVIIVAAAGGATAAGVALTRGADAPVSPGGAP